MIVKSSVDAFVKENEAGQNYGKSSKLWLNGGAGSDTRYAYIFFPRPFDPGVTILEATLRLTLDAAWTGSQTITAKRITERWRESRIKWNDKPAASATHTGTVNVASLADGDVVEIDVSLMMEDVAAGDPWHGIRLELSVDSNRALASSDHPNADRHPELEVVWTDAPQAPTSLSPGGGRAVSAAKPVLTWVFTDLTGVDAQSAAQVQISTSTDFSSPSYDSTKVVLTGSLFDLNDPPAGAGAFSSLAADAVRYWRVKVWNGADEESDWSETQEFTRKTYGTLTIDNPADGFYNLVSNPSFETNTTGWAAETGATLTRVAEHADEGEYSLKVEAPAAYAGARYDFPITAGRGYRMVAKIYAEEDIPNIQVFLYAYTTQAFFSILNGSFEAGWNEIEIEGVAPVSQVDGQLYIRHGGVTQDSTFWVDSVAVIPYVPEAEDMADAHAAISLFLGLDSTTTGLDDLSGNGYDGTGQGGISVGAYTDGPNGLARSTNFDGSNDYVSIPYTTRRNMVSNPSFETNTTGWLMGWGGGSSLSLTRTTDWSRSGTYSARCQGTGAASFIGAYHDPMAVTAGQTYTVSCRVRARVSGTFEVMTLDYTGGPDHYVTGTAAVLTAGQEADISVTTTIGAGNTLLTPIIRQVTSGTVDFDLDAVLVELGGSVDTYFDGSSSFVGTGFDYAAAGISVGWTGTAHASTSDKGCFANGTKRTFFGWARKDTSSTLSLMGSNTLDATSRYVIARVDPDDSFRFWPNDVGAYAEWTSGVWPGNDEWVFWAVTFDEPNDVAELFINGASEGTDALGTQFNRSNWPFIGTHAASNWFWDGKIAHFGIAEKLLTAAEQAAIMAATDPTEDLPDYFDGDVGGGYWSGTEHASISISTFVEETTPPIAWTLTGRTQTAWHTELYRVESSGLLTALAGQSKVAGDEESWTIPAGILRTGDLYRVYVIVWDEYDRAGMAGDPGYVVESRTFIYTRAGSVTPVETLVAVAEDARVVLTFERSTFPDYFAVRADGVEVYDRIDPTDVHVADDEFAFEYWLARPRQTHTYEVEAVVDDGGVLKHSDDNATDAVETRPIGIWLADPVDSLGVFIAGKEKASIAIGKVAGVFDVLGSRAPVTVTDVVQGYRGNFNGVLLDAETRDDFLEMVGRLTVLRLIIGDLNIPVELGDISGPMPTPTGDASGYDVGFTFVQVDEFDEAFVVSGD